MINIAADQKSATNACRLTILKNNVSVFTDRDSQNKGLYQTGIIADGKIDGATIRHGLDEGFATIYHYALLHNMDAFDF